MTVRRRAAARAARLTAAYLTTFEVPALTAALRGRARTRDTALQVYSDCCARLFTHGFPRAGMRLTMPDTLPIPPADRPVVVLARHAGTLNSHLLLHLVLNVLGRRPVCPGRLRSLSDPALAALTGPTEAEQFWWNEAGRMRALRYIGQRAAALTVEQALVIFPEGTNNTAKRSRDALAALRAAGHDERAAWASGLRHVLPPHRAGVVAALARARGADVMVVGHRGTEDLVSWAYPTCCPPRPADEVEVTWWHVPAEEVPRAPRAVVAWLDEQWQRLDDWLCEPGD